MHPPTFFFHCNQNVAEMQNFSGLSGLGNCKIAFCNKMIIARVCDRKCICFLKEFKKNDHILIKHAKIQKNIDQTKTI